MNHISSLLTPKIQLDQPTWNSIEYLKFQLQEFSNTNILSHIYFLDLETYVDGQKTIKALVLKLAVSPASSITAIWNSEYEVMTALFSLGYPVPEVFSYSDALSSDQGAYILMERVAGDSLINLLKESDEHRFEELSRSYNEAAVQLHNLKDKGSVPVFGRKNQFFTDWNPSPMTLFINDYLRFASQLDYKTLINIAQRLKEDSTHLETSLELGVTHGDMQTNNLIYKNGSLSSVIDWGFAKTADIRLDIYWNYMLNTFDFGHKKSKLMLDQYLTLQPRRITDSALFIPLSCLRLFIGLSQLASSSKKYHAKVDKMLKAADISWIQGILNNYMGTDLPAIDVEFRKQMGIDS